MLLYCAYQAQSDALAPLRLFADAARGLLDQPWPGIGDLPLVRGAAAALNLFSHTRLSHERSPFGIDRVTVDGAEIAVSEEVVEPWGRRRLSPVSCYSETGDRRLRPRFSVFQQFPGDHHALDLAGAFADRA